MLLGAVILLLIPPTRTQWAFYVFGMGYFLSTCLVFWVSRFAFPVVPMYLALGFYWLADIHGDRRSRLGRALGGHVSAGLRRLTSRDSAAVRIGVSIVIGALLVSQVHGVVMCEKFYLEGRPLFILPAAEFLNEHAERKSDADREIVLARKAHIAYYAGMEYATYPQTAANSREFVAAAVDRGADYVVFSILEYAYRKDAGWLLRLDNELGVEKIYSKEKIRIFELADWLDLDESAGRVGLKMRVAHLQSLDASNDAWSVMQACTEIYLLYFYNGELDNAAEYLLRSLEAAGRLPSEEESAFYTDKLQDELALLARAYARSGRRADALAIIDEAREYLDTDSDSVVPSDSH
jgi:hypothetical protein